MRAALCLGLVLSSLCLAGRVRADDVAPRPALSAPSERPADDAGHKRVLPHAARPVFVGVLAALFLIMGGAAGANDKPSRREP